MSFNPYLNFGGTCREAFTRYHEILGGDLVLLPMSEAPGQDDVPPEQADLIMHAALTVGGGVLMASDVPDEVGPAGGVYVNHTVDDVGEAKRVFDALADGGTVTMPFGETFWSPGFGMCIDRFGIPWMVNTEAPDEG